MIENKTGRTTFEVVLIMIAVEHLLLGIKIVMAELIPDVPKEVVADERRRPKIEERFEDEMGQYKREYNLKTIREIMEQISAENKQKAQESVDREIERAKQDARNTNVDPEAIAAKKRKKLRFMEEISEIQEKAMDQ